MRIVQFLVLMSLFNNVCAQYESIFGDESTSWNLFQEYSDGFGTDSLYMKNDTTINALEYKAINDLYGEPCFLRESTNSSKVFLYSPSLSEFEFLVLDLTLQKGDVFMLGINNSDTLIVDSVFYIEGRKHIQFNYNIEFALGKEKFEFIEGVGTNFGLFYQGIDPYEIHYSHYLLCADKNSVLSYLNRAFYGQCNVTWTGVDSNKGKRELNVFPNPSKRIVTIDIEDESIGSVDVDIYNSNGLLVQSIYNALFPISIPVRDFQAGLYFFSLQIDNYVVNDKFFILK